MFIYELLNEMIWEDRYTAGEAAKRHPNALIHFTKLQKLGINPRKTHSDAPGIYFYPCKWLLSEDASLNQYATHYEYYYICKLKNVDKMVNLGTMKQQTIVNIAKKNGFYSEMERIRQNPSVLEQDHRTPYKNKKLFSKPGGFFWSVVHYLASVENMSWVKLLRGIDVIYDPGLGIIASEEPAQYIVLNPRVLTIIDHGSNKDKLDTKIADVAKKVAKDTNGIMTFKDKTIVLSYENKGFPFTVTIKPWSFYPYKISYFRDGFWYSETERSYNSDAGDAESYERDILYRVKKAKENAEAPGPDLYWTSGKVKEIVKSIKQGATRFYENVRDEKLCVRYMENNGALSNWHLNFYITKDDVLIVDVDSEFVRNEIKFNHEFGKVPIETVVEYIRSEIKSKLNSDAIDHLSKVGWNL